MMKHLVQFVLCLLCVSVALGQSTTMSVRSKTGGTNGEVVIFWSSDGSNYVRSTSVQISTITNAITGVVASSNNWNAVWSWYFNTGSNAVTTLGVRSNTWDLSYLYSVWVSNQVVGINAISNSWVNTNDTRRLELTHTNNEITVRDPETAFDAVNQQTLNAAISELAGTTVYGATNAHPVLTGTDGTRFQSEVPPPWTNTYALPTLATDDILVGVRIATNPLSGVTIPAGTRFYHTVFCSGSSSGLGNYRSDAALFYQSGAAVITNVLARGVDDELMTDISAVISFSEISTNVVISSSSTQWLGMVRRFDKLTVGAGQSMTVYGGTNYPTHLTASSFLLGVGGGVAAATESLVTIGIWGLSGGSIALLSQLASTNAGKWKVSGGSVVLGNVTSADMWWETNGVGEVSMKGIP